MPINPHNPFKGRQYPGEVIVLCVRWYLRYPLSYEHVTELVAERGVEVDASCIWRWVQAYAPELNKRCRPHLKPTNKSYRIDETYIKVKGEDKYLASSASDAEAKTTPNGKAVTTLSLAIKTSYRKDGERQERAEWHRIQAWGSLGEYAAAFRKGSHLCVEGELRSREYESNGTKVRTYDIVASSIINLRAGQRYTVPVPDEAAA